MDFFSSARKKKKKLELVRMKQASDNDLDELKLKLWAEIVGPFHYFCSFLI